VTPDQELVQFLQQTQYLNSADKNFVYQRLSFLPPLNECEFAIVWLVRIQPRFCKCLICSKLRPINKIPNRFTHSKCPTTTGSSQPQQLNQPTVPVPGQPQQQDKQGGVGFLVSSRVYFKITNHLSLLLRVS
jgi:hypothetical protein